MQNKNTLIRDFNVRQLLVNSCSFFLLGLILFFMGNRYLRYFFPDSICSLSSFLGILFISLSAIFAKRKKSYKNTDILCYLFFLYNIVIVINAFFESNFNLNMIWSNLREITNYLSPFMILFPFFKYQLRTILYISILSCILAVLFVVFQWKELITEPAIIEMGFFNVHVVNRASVAATMVIPALLFLGLKETPKWMKYLIIFSAFLGLLAALLSGRRSSSFTILLMLLFMLSTYYKNFNIKILFYIAMGIVFFDLMGVHNVLHKFISFDFLLERITDNTRKGVESDLVADFDTFSWLFGRGFWGTYYAPSSIDLIRRNMIETGYLHMILKGGVFFLMLYCLILLKTAYEGFCKGKNSLSKLLGLYAFVHLILLYPGGHINFNLDYFILWMGVAYCNNTYFRNLQDVDVKKLIW